MAKVKLSSVAEHVSGKVGDLVFYDKPGGTVLQAAPAKSDKPRSPKQLAGQDRFAQGAAYAKAALQDPRLRPVYQERYDRMQRQGKRNSLFSLAVQDYMRPPQVKAVRLFDYCGRPGDVIHVDTDDDTEVAGVEVIICTPDGVVLERGPAEACLNWWEYRATVAAPLGTCPQVTAVAYDLPGHTGELTMALTEQGHPIGPLVWVPAEAEEAGEPEALETLEALEESDALAALEEPEPAVAEEAAPAPVAAAASPEPAVAVEMSASTTAIETHGTVEDAPVAPPEPAWYWVPAWPVPASAPAWTATALVAVQNAPETALSALWSAPDYTGWLGEPQSPPGEPEVQAVPVETGMLVPVAAAQTAVVPAAGSVGATGGRPSGCRPPAASSLSGHPARAPARAAHEPHVSIERESHPPSAQAAMHLPGPRAGAAEEVHAPVDPVVTVAAPASGTTPRCEAMRQIDRTGGLAQMRATPGPAPPPERRG